MLNILMLSVFSISILVSTYSRGTSEGSTTSRYLEGLSLAEAHQDEKLGRQLSSLLLIPEVAQPGNTVEASRIDTTVQDKLSKDCRNWYVSMKELVHKMGYFTPCTTARVTYATGIT